MIFSGDCIRIPITEHSQVGEARRWVTRLAHDPGFDETSAGKAALVVTELATNLVKYGKGTGELLLQRLFAPRGATALEIIALDRGPGIRDIANSLQDGVSTSGTPGTGLGAVRRACDSFNFHTVAGQGSVFVARLWQGAAPDCDIWGAVSVPFPGEESCGDRWSILQSNGRTVVMIADGLGHGPLAADAARTAAEVLHEYHSRRPAEVLDLMHGALRATRGAAVAVAAIDRLRGIVEYAGIGNIAAAIVQGQISRSLISHNGIVGHEVRKIQEFTYPWDPGSTLLMHSDGVSSRILHAYAAIEGRSPNVVAATLYRDFGRSRDDATMVVVREDSAESHVR